MVNATSRPIAQRPARVVTGCGAQLTQLVESGLVRAAAHPPSAVAQHRSGMDAHRDAVGESGRSASATWRARSQLRRAATMSLVINQAPARMCCAYAPGRSPAASRCSAINAAFSSVDPGSRCSIAAATRRCNWPIGFQLRFVGHRAYQRMPKQYSARGERHVVDQFGVDQRLDGYRFPAPPAAQGRTANRPPPPRSACVWLSGRGDRCAQRWSPATWQAR